MEEEEPKQKSEEKNDEEPANTRDGTEGSQEGDGKPSEPDVSTVKKDEMSETTEYDCSTDDSESLRLIYSSTDQSNCCSGLRVKWNIDWLFPQFVMVIGQVTQSLTSKLEV